MKTVKYMQSNLAAVSRVSGESWLNNFTHIKIIILPLVSYGY